MDHLPLPGGDRLAVDRRPTRSCSSRDPEMTLPTENVTPNSHALTEMEAKPVNKQPTAVPDITPTGKQPAGKADRLRGGCIPCPVRLSPLAYGSTFMLHPVWMFSLRPHTLLHLTNRGTTRGSSSLFPHPPHESFSSCILPCIPVLYTRQLNPPVPPRYLAVSRVEVQPPLSSDFTLVLYNSRTPYLQSPRTYAAPGSRRNAYEFPSTATQFD